VENAIVESVIRPSTDWDAMSAEERQKVTGWVHVGGYQIRVENDTDRLYVDFVADLPLQEWGWFWDEKQANQRGAGARQSGFRGHVQSLWDIRTEKPVASLEKVDWDFLEERVEEMARTIVAQSLRSGGEIDAFKLYMYSLGLTPKERPQHHYGFGRGDEVELEVSWEG
jgi:hypothetical protein